MNKKNTSKNILIVGGGSGIGRAIALSLSKSDHNVVIAGRRKDKLEDVALESTGRIIQKQVDLTDRKSVSNLFDWFDKAVGKIEILINAAGINIPNRTISSITSEEWDKVININLTGSFNCLKETLSRMRIRKSGLIILINSVAGKRAVPLAGVAYNASKFGMHALAVSASEEEKGNGIRITNIYPGEVNTPILDERLSPPSTEYREKILQPQDIAKVVSTIVELPERAHIPELIIKPSSQSFV